MRWFGLPVVKVTSKYCISDSFVDYDGYSISSKGFLPTVVDITVMWNKFIPIPFSSLIPKMLMFTLAFCLITYNLSWFMTQRVQVPIQNFSLWHRTLFSPADTSTTGHLFHSGPASSFFLELFLHSFLREYWTSSYLGGSIFQCYIFFPFHAAYGVFQAKILEWVAISSFSGPYFVRTRHYNPILLRWPCTVWLIASLSYTNPFALTRLWSMKETQSFIIQQIFIDLFILCLLRAKHCTRFGGSTGSCDRRDLCHPEVYSLPASSKVY